MSADNGDVNNNGNMAITITDFRLFLFGDSVDVNIYIKQ